MAPDLNFFLGFTREMRTLNSDEPARKGKGHKILFREVLKECGGAYTFSFGRDIFY